MKERAKVPAALAVVAAALMVLTGVASATTMTSPAGTTYTSGVTAESGTIEIHGSFTTVKCGKSSFGLHLESHGAGVTAGGKLSTLTFTECNFPVKVLKAGSFEFHGTGGGNGTLTSSGAEITIETSIASCTFTTSSTDIGTVTGGTPANVDINSAGIPRTGHSIFCGSSGTWTGNYTVGNPGTLLID